MAISIKGSPIKKPGILIPGGDSGFAVRLGLVFLGLSSLNIWRHEMWRDELQAWLIARDSTSVVNLFQNLRYEGHPGLWHILLYGISRFTDRPVGMQVLHLLIAAVSAYVILRFAPFTRLQRALLIFGYFPFYEYAVLSRSYSLGVLMVFAFCALFPARHLRLPVISGLLFLLANTSAYGWVMSVCLGAVLIAAWLEDRRFGRPWHIDRRWVVLSVLMILLGLVLSALQMMPPEDSGVDKGLHMHFDPRRVGNVLTTVSRSHALIPDFYSQWTMTDEGLAVRISQAFLGLGIVTYTALIFMRKRIVFFAYSLLVGALLLFSYVAVTGTVRHHGHLFIALIACLWLAGYYGDNRPGWPLVDKIAGRCLRCSKGFFAGLLVLHFSAGLAASAIDLFRPFSQGRAAAEYIMDRGMDDLLIVGDKDAHATAVAGYLDAEFYYPAGNRSGTFMIWDNDRGFISRRELLARLDELMARKGQEMLLVLNRELRPVESRRLNAFGIKSFPDSIVADERFWLYLMKPRGEPSVQYRSAD